MEALKLLRSQTVNDKVQRKRLKTIIEKLERYVNGEYFHPDDLSKTEREKYDMERMKQFILDEWDNCENLRCKIEWEKPGYFYAYYMEVPASFEVFMDFVYDDACWCGNCVE